MSRVIRPLKENDYDAFARMNQRAYAGFYSGSNEELVATIEAYKKISAFDDVEAYGLFENDVLLGGMLYYIFDYNFHGEMIKLAGIGSVAVSLLHKKEKVARDLIQFSIDKAKSDSIALFALYPFRADFYRKFGFGYGRSLVHIKTAPSHFRHLGNKDLLEEVPVGNIDQLVDYYNSQAKVTPGMTLKSEADVNRLKKLNGGTFIKAEYKGEILGYMAFTQKKLSDRHGQLQKLEVQECFYHDPKALFAFSSFLNSQKDQVTHVEWHSFDANLFRLLDHIEYTPEQRMMPLISQKYGDIGSGLMYRVLDANSLLSIATKDKEIPSLKLSVMMPDKSYVEYSCGKSGLVVDIEISLQGLSTWLTGSATLEALKWSGEVRSNQSLEGVDYQMFLKAPNFLSRF